MQYVDEDLDLLLARGGVLPRSLHRVVRLVAALRLAYFGIEFAVARTIGSVLLFADNIAFLGDASICIADIALKPRIVAWSMNVENAECSNHDGVRINELAPNERSVASALADAERIVGGAS